MAKKSGGRVGRRPIHRLAVMGNIDGGGRVVAAVPLFQPGQPYPLGLSIQRLQGMGGQGVVVRMVGEDGNMASAVIVPGKDPATVQHGISEEQPTPTRHPEAIVDVGEGPGYPIDTERPGANIHGIGPDTATGPNLSYDGGDASGPQPSDDPSQDEIDRYDAEQATAGNQDKSGWVDGTFRKLAGEGD